jgi:MoxR-like ATPase
LAAGRHYVTPGDIQQAIGPALGHRLILNPGSDHAGTGIEEVISDIVHQVPLPDTAAGAGWRAGG